MGEKTMIDYLNEMVGKKDKRTNHSIRLDLIHIIAEHKEFTGDVELAESLDCIHKAYYTDPVFKNTVDSMVTRILELFPVEKEVE